MIVENNMLHLLCQTIKVQPICFFVCISEYWFELLLLLFFFSANYIKYNRHSYTLLEYDDRKTGEIDVIDYIFIK